jgi:hypothetical protein
MASQRHIIRMAFFAGTLSFFGTTSPSLADQVGREQDIVNLRLGQHILVDDGSCPAGQIKEVFGSKLTPTGIIPTRKCIPRLGTKR